MIRRNDEKTPMIAGPTPVAAQRINKDSVTTEHIAVLQSVRGLAAAVAVIQHIATVYTLPKQTHLWFDVVFNAHAAVVIFFVLSGYVLAKSLLRSGLQPHSVLAFYVRRLFRIYPAVWVASALALVMVLGLRNFEIAPRPTDWLMSYSPMSVTFRQVVTAFAAVGDRLIAPIWTIFVELVGSLAIPGLLLLLRRRQAVVPLFVVLAVVSYVAVDAPHGLRALGYLLNFSLGVAIAIDNPLKTWSILRVKMTAIFGLLCMTAGRPLVFLCLGEGFQPLTYRYGDPTVAFIEAIGAAALVAALSIDRLRLPTLHSKPVVYLGDISYGLYLIHFPVMLASAKVLGQVFSNETNPFLATGVLGLVTLVLSIAFAHLMYRYVELPGIAFGRRTVAHFSTQRMIVDKVS